MWDGHRVVRRLITGGNAHLFSAQLLLTYHYYSLPFLTTCMLNTCVLSNAKCRIKQKPDRANTNNRDRAKFIHSSDHYTSDNVMYRYQEKQGIKQVSGYNIQHYNCPRVLGALSHPLAHTSTPINLLYPSPLAFPPPPAAAPPPSVSPPHQCQPLLYPHLDIPLLLLRIFTFGR